MVKGAGFRSLSCRGSWVQIPPPAPELGHFVSLFCKKILDLGLCGLGSEFEHVFTSKSDWPLWRLQTRLLQLGFGAR